MKHKMFALLLAFLLALPLAAQFTADEIAMFTESDFGQMAKAAAERFAAASTAYWDARHMAQYPKAVSNWKAQFWNNGQLIGLPIPAYKADCKVSRVPIAADEIGDVAWAWSAQGGLDTCDTLPEFVTSMYQPTEDEVRRMTSAQLAFLGLDAPAPPPPGDCKVGPEFWVGAGQFAVLPGDTCAEGQTVNHGGVTLEKMCYVTPFGKVCKYGKPGTRVIRGALDADYLHSVVEAGVSHPDGDSFIIAGEGFVRLVDSDCIIAENGVSTECP